MDKIEELKKIKSLFDQGAISESEFTLLKKQIISNQKESISSENSNKQNDLLKTSKYNLIKNVSYENAKETKTKKKQSNVWQEGNNITGLLLLLGILFSMIAGLVTWYRINFYAFIILTGISITGILLLGKVNKVLNRNLYLALISVGLFLLIFIPIGNHDNSSSNNTSNSSLQDDNSIQEKKKEEICNYCNGTGTQICGLCGGSGVNNLGMTCGCITQYSNAIKLGITPDHVPLSWTCRFCVGTGVKKRKY